MCAKWLKNKMQPNSYLSVAIPTYNREKELVECLNSIVPQAKKFGIRIYVSDNASTNDVGAIIDRFRAEYPWIIYHRNEVNLGLDANVRKLISMVESQYVWLFCDDDIMLNGALERILPLCESCNHQLIVVDRQYRSRDLSKPVTNSSITGVIEPTEFVDPVPLLERYCLSCYTFMGCLVFQLSAWRTVDAKKYATVNWFEHLCVLAEMMLKGKALVLPDCLVYVRSYNATWSHDEWMVWGYHFTHALAVLPDAYPKSSRRRILENWVMRAGSKPDRFSLFRRILAGRAQGTITWAVRRVISEPFHELGSEIGVVVIWLVLLIPIPFLRLLRKCWHGMRGWLVAGFENFE